MNPPDSWFVPNACTEIAGDPETGRLFDRLVRGNFAEAEKLIRLIG